MSTHGARAIVALAILIGAVTVPSSAGGQAAQPVSAAHATPVAPPTHGDSVYFEFQVEKPVQPLPGALPAYPAPLSAAHVTGSVLVQFVVDTLGHPELESFKVLQASNALFVDAVREALPGMRFVPAEMRGRHVRQLVQQPFVFSLD